LRKRWILFEGSVGVRDETTEDAWFVIFSPRFHGIRTIGRSVQRPAGAGRGASPPEKTGVCSCCGRRVRGRHEKERRLARDVDAGGLRIYVRFERWRVRCPACKAVFVERLDWLAENPRYTERFALQVGKLCRSMSNKDVAELMRIGPHTVKTLDKVYMRKQVKRAGSPAPETIGVDEISTGRGHNYRIVVSDLGRNRVIWVGGKGRQAKDLDMFFDEL
jgi:transposase